LARHRSPEQTSVASIPQFPDAQPAVLELTAVAAEQPQASAVRHRAPGRSAALRGRVAVAVVIAGAAAAAVTAGQTLGKTSPSAQDVTLAAGTVAPLAVSPAGGQAPMDVAAAPESLPTAAPNVLPIAKAADSIAAEQLAKSGQMTAERNARAARAAEARRPLYVLPATGTFTSGFGARWGTEHKGDDIANAIGTPIGSITDGVIIEAGPASGFGLWVRVQNDDGTIAVYGHVNEIIAKVGQRVRAGDEIATIGNRGQSTGPHLHFEIWVNGKDKIDPQPWLASHGVLLK
jgi:murein DD-endopeptidase MepM/ murein hydrolase activator NlpD